MMSFVRLQIPEIMFSCIFLAEMFWKYILAKLDIQINIVFMVSKMTSLHVTHKMWWHPRERCKDLLLKHV